MTPHTAYWKAIEVGGFYDGSNTSQASAGCGPAHQRIPGKRSPELEQIILNDFSYSMAYAKNIIKGRWIEAEDVIMNSSYCASCYARHVIGGKLPEKMHNMMILHAIRDSNDSHVKEYFEFIK